ncbi:MAG: phosphatidylserine/phosphatidylglycerophosphate/cardiolipin synthase family protein [Akkermansiaceae bacterium]|nr:phosphatidylserine/phosphatidylglycerophosphate/cardiolipin synthase family protein [Akkermansiaceae bacterium]
MKWQTTSLIMCLSTTSCGILGTGSWKARHRIRPVAMTTEAVQRILITGTAVTVVKNPISSTYKGLCTLKSRSRIAADHWLRHLPRAEPEVDSSLTVEQALDAEKFPKPIPGKVDYFIDGSFYTELHRSVGAATKYVDTQIFSFDNDDVAAAHADLLKRKSSTIRCRVMMDYLGSVASWWIEPVTRMASAYPPPASMIAYLRKDGNVKVRISRNPWLISDHTKLIIVDGKEAYLGGMNIGREYQYEWHDMMVRVKGPIVTAMQNGFNKAWHLQGPLGDWAYPFHRRAQPYRTTLRKGEIPIRMLRTTASNSQINDALITAIKVSKRRIFLHVSYMTSDELMRELVKARKRGVDVRMIFPEKNDNNLLNTNNRSCAYDLIKVGAKVWLYPSSSHTKAVVVDDWACVGSANLDALSLWINGELNIAFSDKDSVDRLLRELFFKDFRKSKRLTLKDVEHWGGSPLEFVADQL